MDYLYLVLGLVVLVIGGEAALRGAVKNLTQFTNPIKYRRYWFKRHISRICQ